MSGRAPSQLVRRRARMLRRVLTALLRLPLMEQLVLARLAADLAIVEVLLRTRPLPWVARALGVAFTGPPPAPVSGALELSARERRGVRCARRLTRHWPFCTGACLRESLLIGHVLRRHHPRLVLGVDRTVGGTIVAHAWLDVQGRIVGDPSVYQRLG